MHIIPFIFFFFFSYSYFVVVVAILFASPFSYKLLLLLCASLTFAEILFLFFLASSKNYPSSSSSDLFSRISNNKCNLWFLHLLSPTSTATNFVFTRSKNIENEIKNQGSWYWNVGEKNLADKINLHLNFDCFQSVSSSLHLEGKKLPSLVPMVGFSDFDRLRLLMMLLTSCVILIIIIIIIIEELIEFNWIMIIMMIFYLFGYKKKNVPNQPWATFANSNWRSITPLKFVHNWLSFTCSNECQHAIQSNRHRRFKLAQMLVDCWAHWEEHGQMYRLAVD